jgi:hypothetical protein
MGYHNRGLAYRRTMAHRARVKARKSRTVKSISNYLSKSDREMMVNKLADNLSQCSCFLCKSEKKLNIPTKQELIALDITKFNRGELHNA